MGILKSLITHAILTRKQTQGRSEVSGGAKPDVCLNNKPGASQNSTLGASRSNQIPDGLCLRWVRIKTGNCLPLAFYAKTKTSTAYLFTDKEQADISQNLCTQLDRFLKSINLGQNQTSGLFLFDIIEIFQNSCILAAGTIIRRCAGDLKDIMLTRVKLAVSNVYELLEFALDRLAISMRNIKEFNFKHQILHNFVSCLVSAAYQAAYSFEAQDRALSISGCKHADELALRLQFKLVKLISNSK